MLNSDTVKIISKILKNKFEKLPAISSAYIYGSVLTNNFSRMSDIDVLFIIDNIDNPNKLLKEIKLIRNTVKDYKLDINVVFMDEFIRRWHIYRPPTYFYWIKSRSVFLWGTDYIKDVKESEITAESLFRRAIDLAQSSRSVYLNNKDDSFWESKYKRWVSTLICEINFLDNELEFDFKICAPKMAKKYPEIKNILNLLQDNPSMEKITGVAENLVCFIRQNYL
ncbi:nucleotidyltransferase domain-containing protein [Patescibacteria group bacterium]|nr:nucleotidyltransferase domain-containing protein [Candidatus Falkowbacteria bacterium]MBU3905832.1 nucleotidyltransferase domain-containing protein [Patescibacteria group bacterium]MBU4015175.1 nucleotidyltransferase domain-containing protein [Patescibacteria group bacterium]MBU4027221.1 nucleotidyltransferase domain-containing protein [Patescibacteria group bacterium]MBU4073400.1 nucleotidyltransferase domain-containing protein [Patescibacteria group bacterium]